MIIFSSHQHPNQEPVFESLSTRIIVLGSITAKPILGDSRMGCEVEGTSYFHIGFGRVMCGSFSGVFMLMATARFPMGPTGWPQCSLQSFSLFA